MINLPDIDMDFGNRSQILELLDGTPARLKNGQKHTTGMYFTDIPKANDSIATVEHNEAALLGYFKLDLLNVSVYEHIRNEEHLVELMTTEPLWSRLWDDKEFCEKVIHINNHYKLICSMKPDSIPRMAMFLAIMRPGKAHLRNKPWTEIAETVWDRNVDGYTFRKSHAVAYAHLVVVHMNLLHGL